MSPKKIKRYRLGVSRYFPKTHKRAGEKTNFTQKIQLGIKNIPNSVMYDDEANLVIDKKIHTIRSNYELWAKRMKEVQAGKAVIELFYWSGSPYNYKRDGSKQVVFDTLDKDSGCGVQIISDFGKITAIVRDSFDDSFAPIVRFENLSKNDGLSLDDFKDWFESYDLSKPMAIIQFTKFRY